MALTGNNSSGWLNGYFLKIQSDITSQSIENNTSTVRTRAWLYSQAGYNFWGVSSTHNLNVNGSQLYNNYVTSREIGMNSSVLVMDSTSTITHAADGTATLSATAGFSNTYTGNQTVSLTYAITTIPRATTPNIAGGGGFTTGSASTINLPRASSGFTHDVSYTVGTKTGTIATGAGASTSWTPADSLTTEFTTAAASQAEITVVTKQGATTIGSKKVNFTLTAGAAVVPSVSAVTWSDSNAVVATNIGAFVQGRSLIKGVVTAAGVHGSTITSKQVVVAGATVAENQPMQVFGSGAVTASGVATDSRGRVGSKSANFTVLSYEDPRQGVNGIEVTRANVSNVADPVGQYLRLDLHAIVSSLKPASTEKNGMKIEVFTKPSNGAETARNVINTGLTHNSAVQISGGATYLVGTSYEVRVVVTDKAGGRLEKIMQVSTATVALHLADNGVGVGKYHEHGALDVAGDAYFDGNINAKDASLERINPFATKALLDAWSAPDGTIAWVTATSTQYTRVGGVWVAPETNHVIQTQTFNMNTQKSSTSTSWADTSIEATITPTSASSTIMVIANNRECIRSSGDANAQLRLRVLRGGTEIAVQKGGFTGTSSDSRFGSMDFMLVDTPASTSALTYKVQIANDSTGATVSIGGGSITLMELRN